MSAGQLREFWIAQAIGRAGIDRAIWRPKRGISENRPCVEASYNYYADLFLGNDFLKWAGMARMIAACFYAGFEDLDALRRSAGGLSSTPWALPARREARLANKAFTHYEKTFLHMQKKIFEDQAMMHEAYLTGGLDEILRLYWARIIDRATLKGWRQIDTGRRTNASGLVDQGNRALLFREQFDIIDRFYAGLFRYKKPVGPIITYLMTLSGGPSIPGARSFPDAFPVRLELRTPLGTLALRTPLAEADIAVFAHRWKLTDTDTLPTFLAYLCRCSPEARRVIQTPIAQRMRTYRLSSRARQLAVSTVLGWRVEAGRRGDQRFGPLGRLFVRGTKVVDLTQPPTRRSLGVPSGAPSRTWMNSDLQPFPVEVKLPAGRPFRRQADAVVVLCPDPHSPPERLIVRHPPMIDDEAEDLIRGQSSRWGFPPEAVNEWRAHADSLGDDRSHYSTRVFTPDTVGFVQLEFQVAQHVHEGEFVITTHFTWDPSFVPAPLDPKSID